MCSTRGARALPRAGCPIQKSPDHRSLPTPRCLSQVAASFFGSWYLGIHLGPLLACSTYNHSSVAEEAILRSRRNELKKEDPDIAYGILEISIDLFGCQCAGGDERARTADPLLAKQVLSQLSYIPWGTLCVLLATSIRPIRTADGRCLPPRADLAGPAGGTSDLESLKSGKDRTKPWIFVCLICTRTNETRRISTAN